MTVRGIQAGLNRAVGAAAGSTLALALLVCGCVFAAMAGPALSLHTRSQALHQTMARLAPTVKTVQVSADWSNFAGALSAAPNSGGRPDLTASQLTQATGRSGPAWPRLPLPLGGGRLGRPEREAGRWSPRARRPARC